MKSTEIFIHSILSRMTAILSTDQLSSLREALSDELRRATVTLSDNLPSADLDPFNQLLNSYLALRSIEGLTEGTLIQYRSGLNRFSQFLNKSILDTTKNDVRCYVAFLSQQMSKTSVSNQLCYIRPFLTWLHDEGYLPTNPGKNAVTIKPEPKEIDYLSPGEIIDIQDAASSLVERAIINLLFSTGLRCGEVHMLNLSNLDIASGQITLISEKSNRARTVFLTPRAAKDVAAYITSRTDSLPYLFISKRKSRMPDGSTEYTRMSVTTLEDITKCVGQRAGVSRVRTTVHIFRKTFATSLLNNGCPVEIIQALLGHSSPETTLGYYAKMTSRTVREAFDRYIQIV